MSAPKNDTPANASTRCGLTLFEDEPLCAHHETPNALSSINVSTFLDDYISRLDDTVVAQLEEELSDSREHCATHLPHSVLNLKIFDLNKSVVKA